MSQKSWVVFVYYSQELLKQQVMDCYPPLLGNFYLLYEFSSKVKMHSLIRLGGQIDLLNEHGLKKLHLSSWKSRKVPWTLLDLNPNPLTFNFDRYLLSPSFILCSCGSTVQTAVGCCVEAQSSGWPTNQTLTGRTLNSAPTSLGCDSRANRVNSQQTEFQPSPIPLIDGIVRVKLSHNLRQFSFELIIVVIVLTINH